MSRSAIAAHRRNVSNLSFPFVFCRHDFRSAFAAFKQPNLRLLVLAANPASSHLFPIPNY